MSGGGSFGTRNHRPNAKTLQKRTCKVRLCRKFKKTDNTDLVRVSSTRPAKQREREKG